MPSSLLFLINTVAEIYIYILLLRVWMQCIGADFYNPAAQFIVKMTQPVVAPLRRILPSIGFIDTASIIVAYVVALIKLFIILKFPNYLSPFFYALLVLLKSAGFLLFWLLVIRAIMSWISSGRSAIDYQLYQLTEPVIAPIRKIIPAFAGLDFSAMIVVFILFFLNSVVLDLVGIIWNYL